MDSQIPSLLRVENLVKLHTAHAPFSRAASFIAVNGVSFSLPEKKTLALVGASGSGKSTLALCIALLEPPTSGSIWFNGQDAAALSEAQLRNIRTKVQLVFQDPARSLNPRWSVFDILSEPFYVQNRFAGQARENKILALLDCVALPQKLAHRRPDELSGGQKQRLAIARALALEPKLVVLDEALSALDCSIQAQIANLLVDLQASLGVGYVFITHDLTMAAHLADQIIVLHRGEIAESGAPEQILHSPSHEATRALLAAMPHPIEPPQSRAEA